MRAALRLLQRRLQCHQRRLPPPRRQRQRRRVPRARRVRRALLPLARRRRPPERRGPSPRSSRTRSKFPVFYRSGRRTIAPGSRSRQRCSTTVFFSINMDQGHRRAHAFRRADGNWYSTAVSNWTVSQGSWQRSPAGEEHDVYRARGFAGRALCQEQLFRQPAGLSANRERAASGAQVDPGRCQRAADDRHAARVICDRARISELVFVRCTQFISIGQGECDATVFDVLPTTARRASVTRHRRQRRRTPPAFYPPPTC